MKIAVVSPRVPKDLKSIINIDDYVIYACDQAVEELIRQNIHIHLAIGDFDSIENKDLLNEINIIKLSEVKDVSDTKHAIKHAYTVSDEVILVGGIKGNRVDHLIANLYLFDEFKDLRLIDDTNLIYIKEEGSYKIDKLNYNYLSIFPIKESIVSIGGVKYPLKEKKLKAYDALGLSNQIINNTADLVVVKGKVLIIQSKDK